MRSTCTAQLGRDAYDDRRTAAISDDAPGATDVAMIGIALLSMVMLGLSATALAQFRPMPRMRSLLDRFALVPEWRFYAQASIASSADLARDPHLIVRDRYADGTVDRWRAVLSHAERRLLHSVWNPRSRVDDVLLEYASDLVRARPDDRLLQQSIRYIAVLRHVLEAPRDRPDVVHRQFALVHTIGRRQRSITVDFLSAWHRW